MTDIILKSQLKGDDIFYLPSFKQGKIEDDFLPVLPLASQPGMWRKIRLTAVNSPTANSANTFFIPPHGTLLSDMYLISQWGAPSGGTYSSFIGAQAITHVIADFNGEQLVNYNYRPVFQHQVSSWPIEYTAKVLAAAGGATPGAITACAPIFVPWGSFKHEKNDFPMPLPFSASNTSLRLEVTLDSVANLLAAGGSGGSLSALTLVYYEFICSSEELQRIESVVKAEDWKMLAIDYQTLNPTTVPTGSESAVDCTGLNGSIKEICFPIVLSSDIATAHNYLITNLSTAVNLQIDGVQVYEYLSSNEGIMDQLLFNSAKVGDAATIGTARCINFSRRKDSHDYSGAVNSESYKRLTLNVTHALGANAAVFISAACYRWYVYRGGRFIRIKN